MKSFLTILLISFAINANAQKIRFTNSTNQWTTLSIDGDGCSSQNSFSYSNDTIVSGITYKTMLGSGTPYFGYHDECYCGTYISNFQSAILIREDTTTGIVYYFNQTDSAEHILYNYNLNVGDSISYSIYTEIYTDTVASIDSVLYNGVYYKIFNFQNKALGSDRSYTVLEGIGCTNDPMFPSYFGGCFEYGESLVCFYENGVRPGITAPINSCSQYGSSCFYGSGFNNITGCGMFLSTDNIDKTTPNIIISPNPAFDYIDITTSGQFDENTTISVYDIDGSCILKTNADVQKDKVEVNTSYWSDGLYMVIVQNNTGIIKKEKIVVMK